MKTGFQNVPLDQIVPSKTNPRKTFDEAALKDLAESIRKHGVLQPILLRPAGKGFEIVAGERRFRAAKLADLKEIPASVSEMDDETAEEKQLIENLQRADPEPMEEAQGYKMLIDKHKYSVADLAAKVQKTASYIHHRLGLMKLHPEVQKAIAEGVLGLGLAEILGRIDDPDMQRRIFEHERFESVAELKKIVEEKYMLDLKKAPWKLDDAALFAKAGACSACPKRSSAQGDLFGAGKKDFCLDPACWNKKVDCHAKALAEKYRAEGKTVVVGKEAEQLLRTMGNYGSKVTSLDSGLNSVEIYRSESIREALKGKEVSTFLAIGTDGRPVELVEKEEVLRALPKRSSGGVDGSGHASKMSPAEKAKRKKVIRTNKVIKEMRRLLIEDLAKNAPVEIEGKLLSAVAEAMVKTADYAARREVGSLLSLNGMGGDSEFDKTIKKWGTTPLESMQVLAILHLAITFGIGIDGSSGIRLSGGLPLIASALGIDLKKMEKKASDWVDDVAAGRAGRGGPKPDKKPKPSKKQTERTYNINGRNVKRSALDKE